VAKILNSERKWKRQEFFKIIANYTGKIKSKNIIELKNGKRWIDIHKEILDTIV
jgi:hypothetical protein